MGFTIRPLSHLRFCHATSSSDKVNSQRATLQLHAATMSRKQTKPTWLISRKRKRTISRRDRKRLDMEQFHHFGTVCEGGPWKWCRSCVRLCANVDKVAASATLSLCRAIDKVAHSCDKIAGVASVLAFCSKHCPKMHRFELGIWDKHTDWQIAGHSHASVYVILIIIIDNCNHNFACLA